MDILLAVLGFVIVTAITPGPNNLLLAAASMRFGPRATVPHLAGIILGFSVMLFLSALGLSALLAEQGWILNTMKVGASLYLLYLAFTLLGFRLEPDSGESTVGVRPLTVVESILFQCVNPKSWIMCAVGLSLATSMNVPPFQAAVLVLACFSSAGLACNGVWIFLGAAIRRYLHGNRARAAVNGALFLLTVATVGIFWCL